MITFAKIPIGTLYNSLPNKSNQDLDRSDNNIETQDQSAGEVLSDKSIDTVSISSAGQASSNSALVSSSTQYYEQFMPTYDGFSAKNIASGVSEPGIESFSAGKNFEQVAIDARASLDKNYDRLEEIGKPYSVNSSKTIDRNSLIGELDRRALYAVASNEGGLFTKNEQDVALSKMRQQQSLAMGLYSGPTSEKDKFITTFGNFSQKFKLGIEFLDGVSKEEQAGSIEFAFQRASLQRSYENSVRENGEIPEDFSTDNSLVRLLFDALKLAETELESSQTFGNITDADDLLRQPWFEIYAESLEKTRGQYLGDS
ncbi:hypothetical protein J3L16_11840 [Alteromonas sp. 5E99-2]|uniref:hypothetical protein n=1 Tax=Alteromonas sp. 5E99-2 TaxID=2817683 RepID=UPI001A982216|nr:hypothetical protein [Alteromonas sp. 5E99-2]MBO1256374.1 hypothetical protein [Alteromonas sp. 5E99-2]